MRVLITDLDHFGRGITKVDGKTTFVENALPEEEVEIEIVNDRKNFNEAKVIKYLTSSKYRRNVTCPYYSLCGGCNLMHMAYDKQLVFKKDKLKNILKKYDSLDIDVDIEPSDNEFNYRNKITLHKCGDGYGYKIEKSSEVVKIDNCLIVKDSINDYISKINNFDKEELVVRTNDDNEIISNLEDNYIIEKIKDFRFQIDIKSFFQVNSYIFEKIFDYISNNISSYNVALDLYSGVGTLSSLISKKVNKVYAIEVNKNSHKNALVNKKLNDIKNIEFINGKVEDTINSINEKVDLIVTDPPRSGMDKSVIDAIIKFKPQEIVYMSCEPLTMARDLNLLKDYYEVKRIKAFDMFPNTYHVETICILERK